MIKLVRTHNEWFRTVSLGNRKSCPTCHSKLKGESIWSWGEYRYAKWRTVKHFCRHCFHTEVQAPLQGHGTNCSCRINLVIRASTIPSWLTLPSINGCTNEE